MLGLETRFREYSNVQKSGLKQHVPVSLCSGHHTRGTSTTLCYSFIFFLCARRTFSCSNVIYTIVRKSEPCHFCRSCFLNWPLRSLVKYTYITFTYALNKNLTFLLLRFICFKITLRTSKTSQYHNL